MKAKCISEEKQKSLLTFRKVGLCRMKPILFACSWLSKDSKKKKKIIIITQQELGCAPGT